MTQTLESGYRTTTTSKIAPSDTTIFVKTSPAITKGRLYLSNWWQEERVSFDTITTVGSAYRLNNCVRWLSRSADPATAWTWLTWIAGTVVKIVLMHDQPLDKQNDQTMTAKLDFGSNQGRLEFPEYTTVQRDAIVTWANGEVIHNTTTGTLQQYITGAWSDFGNSATANASTTVAGKVEIATDAEVTSGTNTWGTGAQLVTQPSQLKNTNDNLDTEKLKIKSKVDVVVATTANITLSGTQTIDWVAVTAWQRVLVKDQTAWAENGIYLCASGAWTRATDFDANTNNEVDLWANVWVQGGTIWAGTQWVLSTTGTITVWSTSIAFTQTFPATNYISSVALTTPLTVPATCNVILIEATAADGSGRTQKWDIILTRVWKTTWSIQWAETNGVNNTPWVACSWSGSTLTTTLTWTTLWGNVYYYKSL